MFFTTARRAKKYAQMEAIRTHRKYVVVRCNKYLCPTDDANQPDSIPGFTVVIRRAS